MVLYKRKRVSFMKPPDLPGDLKQEVFYIPATMEWFFNYDEYLDRMDYYRRRKFVCEITGNSCLTYFEALSSEEREIKGVEKNFPEALREHILRFLQFNRITRLDQLVDKVYSVFKNEYFPGENIYIRGMNNSDETYDSQNAPKQRGTIREKVQYGQSDSLTTKYLVVRLSDMQQAIVTKDKISRDRNHFTKWLIKTFIKLTMSRSHKVGAPWVVKDKFAIKYRISQEYPDDLKHFAYSTPTGEALYEDSDQGGSPSPTLNEVKTKRSRKTPSSKGVKGKSALNNLIDLEDNLSESGRDDKPVICKSQSDPKRRFQTHYLPDRIQREVEAVSGVNSPSNQANSSTSFQPTKKNIVDDLDIKFDIQNTKPTPKQLELNLFNTLGEDDRAMDVDKEDKIEPDLSMNLDSIQEGLQVWTFLNIYHNTLKLDTFTFDDFIYAMHWNKIQFDEIGRCELLDEIWCAVLSAFVSNEIPSQVEEKEADANNEIFGLLITVPSAPTDGNETDINSNSKVSCKNDDFDEESGDSYAEKDKRNHSPSISAEIISEVKEEEEYEEEEEEEDDDDDVDDEGNNEEDDDVREEDNDEEEDDDDKEEQDAHNAYNVMNYRNTPWHERLRKRNFKDGNWQCILLGVLSLVERMPGYAELVNEIYLKLAPLDFPPNTTTVLSQFYEELDINLRLKVLNILVELLMNGSMVRNYIDECLDESTNLRRERLDCIREIKSSIEVAQKQNITISDITNDSLNKEKSDSTSKRSRLNFKVTEVTEDEQQLYDSNQEYKDAWNLRKNSLVKIEQYKNTKKELEKKLNELDCQRVKLLGKDRLYNRYWWFENNGLPTLHGNSNDDEEENEEDTDKNDDSNPQEDSDDILDETYLMGKLWVQGPSQDDVKIHLKSNYRDIETLVNILGNSPVNFSIFAENKSDEEIDNKEDGNTKESLKELNFENIPSFIKMAMEKELGLYVDSNRISLVNPNSNLPEELLDNFGGLIDPANFQYLQPLQRKVIEELPDPLLNGSFWRFYDNPEEINKLIEWLNPWGKRESQLRKELINAKDAIIKNMNARSKAFSTMKVEEEEKNLIYKLNQVTTRIESLESGENLTEQDSDSVDPNQNSKRSLRSDLLSRKKQKSSDSTDIFKFGNISDLRRLKIELESKLEEEKKKRESLKVLEWINSKAIDLFDKSLYEGGDKAKVKASRRTKNLK